MTWFEDIEDMLAKGFYEKSFGLEYSVEDLQRTSTALRLLVEVARDAKSLAYLLDNLEEVRINLVSIILGQLKTSLNAALANEDAAQLLGGDDETE